MDKNTKLERSECTRCGDPLEGGAKTLCLQCQDDIITAYDQEEKENE